MVSATSRRSRSPFATSARPSTASGTQNLVAAAHSAMGEDVGRFAPYSESVVPAFGGDRRLRARSIQPRQDGDPQHIAIGWFDSATTASAFAIVAPARAGHACLGDRESARAHWRRPYSPSEEKEN